jgi:hypothetical protein
MNPRKSDAGTLTLEIVMTRALFARLSRKMARNPHTHPGVSGDALADFAKAVYTAFPDFHIELLNADEIEPGIVATHWLLTCTNTGQRIEGATHRTKHLNQGSCHHSA